MSLVATCNVVFKKGLTPEQIQETAQEIKSLAGNFMVVSRNEPITVSINKPNAEKLEKIRALPYVERVAASHRL